jgi:hypothetical protein
MKLRNLLTATGLSLAVLFNGGTANAQDAQTCQPGIGRAIAGPHAPQYQALIAAIIPFAPPLFAQLPAVIDQPTYQILLTIANSLAGSIPTGRVVITVPDGTVMIDTNRDDDTANPNSNSYAHFLAKTINENHNSRLAILAAQEYACGVGLETKFSTTTGQNEVYLALRVGGHLDNFGTVRLSITQ